MGNLLHDVRIAWRVLGRNRQVTLFGVLIVTLGIGANAAVFSVLNAALLRPLPFADFERLVMVWDRDETSTASFEDFTVSAFNFLEYARQNRSFEKIGAVEPVSFSLTGVAEPRQVSGAAVSADLLPLLGVEPIRGRLFAAPEDQPGAARVVLLSHGFWRRHCDPEAELGQLSVLLDGAPYTPVGVLPPGFHLPFLDAELWVPLGLDAGDTSLAQRRRHYLYVSARLRAGVDLEQAREDLRTIAGRLALEYPDTGTGWSATARWMREDLVAAFRPQLLVLQLGALFVLAIVGANLMNLLLLQTARRRTEIAVRAALGAGRRGLGKQFLLESLLLVVPGGILGMLLATLVLTPLVALSPLAAFPVLVSGMRVDPAVVGFSLLLVLAIAVVCAAVPWIQGGRPDLHGLLRSRAAGAISQKVLNGLVAGELALAVVLLVGAGLMLKSFRIVRGVDPGFDAENRLAAQVTLPETFYAEAHARSRFVDQVVERIEALPGVRSAAVTNMLPMRGLARFGTFVLEARRDESSSEVRFARLSLITPDYFRSLGIALEEGRYFDARDHAGAAGTAIVSRTMAARYWPGVNALGQRLQRGRQYDPDKPWLTVVGIVDDVRFAGLAADTEPAYYLPYAQHAGITQAASVEVVVDLASRPGDFARTLGEAIWSVDRNVPISQVATLEAILSDTLADVRFSTLLTGIFAGLALVLGLLGIYGVVAQFVQQQHHDLGIRMALGATRREILRLVLRRGLSLTLLGLAVGLAAVLALTRFLADQLYEVDPLDPTTLFSVGVMLAAMSLAAYSVPAWRAATTDPAEVLRHE